MKARDTIFIGFTLFALFFGAGNLIYPVSLGIESGTSYFPAIFGFVITGVGLPIVTVAAISLVRNGAVQLAGRVHPRFGLLFTAMVYLVIGPFFAIPRAANVAFETGIVPFTNGKSLTLFIFTVLFFVLVYWLSRNPSKLVDRVGQILTPTLFLAILGLVIGSFFMLDGQIQPAGEKYQAQPFFTGFIEGYLTMDAIASLAFGIIVVSSFRDRGVTDPKELTRRTLKAGLVTAIGLTTVYVAIGWIGARMATEGSFDNGSAILAGAAQIMYGDVGTLLLGVIVGLACLTTCIGLTVACGQFFSKRVPGMTYHHVIIVVTLISFAISNIGLNQIIAYSVPVLVFVYPITIVLVALTFMSPLFNHSPYVYRGAILLTSVIGVYDGLVAFGADVSSIEPLISQLPLFELNLSWVFPAIVGGIIGLLIDYFKGQPRHKESFQNG
ncbi:branched-chain amino acid transport system II carrier protein [Halobacillus sp. Nhm2S1]|uniref:branched-chain amino acid transport system II carrier protein n=1 Tax=Halobacillus sp. Nhm2S1 TaxID=2866716 RepID=UPI001C732994|nr:branched-chain amino acid transport system II carrier protein [Halobacillus sp. Nhm2S1]MBX0357962.1 branched-chain amino acid transport system II carrier protein [Halobacillus sp. Nhm2S1]